MSPVRLLKRAEWEKRLTDNNSGIVQLADVIVGAIAAKRNNVVHSSPKGDLAEFVLKASGRQDWSRSTPKDARFLTLWNFEGR